MNNNKYFFCYDKELAKFLAFEKQLPYITIAINPRTLKKFTLFERTLELTQSLDEWSKKNN